jgi:hypothetical protein
MGTYDGSGAVFGERHENIKALLAVEAGIVVKRHTLILSLFNAEEMTGGMENRGLWSGLSLPTPTDPPIIPGISKALVFLSPGFRLQ